MAADVVRRPSPKQNADVIFVDRLPAISVHDPEVITHPCRIVEVFIRDQRVTRIAKRSFLLRVVDRVPRHDGHEPAKVHGAGTETLDAFVQHSGEEGLERGAEDLSNLQAPRPGWCIDPISQIDEVQINGEKDVEVAADPSQVAHVFPHPEHLLVGFLVDEAGDVVQAAAVFRRESGRARVDEVQGGDKRRHGIQ